MALVALFLSQHEIAGAILSVAIASWQGLIWRGNEPAPVRSIAEGKPSIRVLAANLQWSNGRRVRAIEILRSATADILVLAEPRQDWLSHIERLEAEYPYRSNARWPDASGPTILSRLPILQTRTYHPLVESIAHQKYGLSLEQTRLAAGFSFEEAVVALSGRVSITLLGIHAPSPGDGPRSAMRNDYFERLASHCAGIEGPLLVAGDFNVTPWSPFYRDFIRTTGLLNATRGRLATWPAWLGPLGIPIDHALRRGAISLVRIAPGPPLGSDHRSIEFSVTLAAGPS
ncbi:endonuclease/exonuclease/phosphatase family protein [Hypericibacter sp.]|uniref:endonuclease/exonuclease/phosphatase family protein n=1 Tax=Hypericibacter sp. TaxID=2705401 RepID=UPI003D6D2BED